nr:hypothetical protein Itr_chr11CG15920 [Ipomoea trifida]
MGVVATSQEAKKKTKSKTSVTKGASVQTTNDVSTSKAPESSKGPAQEKKKRKPPKKRKGEPSKRPSKRPKKTPKPSIAVTETLVKETSTMHVPPPVVLPTTEETSHEHSDDNDVLPIDLEVVVSTSNLPLLTPKEDAETAALESNVLPPPLLIHDDYSDEDDVFPLTRALSKRQKMKELEPSSPSTRGLLLPLRKPQAQLGPRNHLRGKMTQMMRTNPKEQERADLNMIARVTSISRIQSSFRDIRPGVGTSRENEVPEDCKQQKEDEDKEPEKETSEETPENSSSSNDLDNDDNDNQGVSNHPHDEEELRVIPSEDTHPEYHHQVFIGRR